MKKLLTFFVLLLASQNIQAQQSEATLSNSGNDNDYWETELFGDGPNGQVHAIAIKGDNIFVGGLFNAAGGQPANNIARFNTVTETWHALGSGVNGIVYALAIIGDNIFVGGFFFEAVGQPANYIARFNIVTETWHTLGSGVSNFVYTLEVAGTHLYVGGQFLQAGGNPARRVAIFDTVTDTWKDSGWPGSSLIPLPPLIRAIIPPYPPDQSMFPMFPIPLFKGGKGAAYLQDFEWNSLIEYSFNSHSYEIGALALYNWGEYISGFNNMDLFVGMFDDAFEGRLRRYRFTNNFSNEIQGFWVEDAYNFNDRIYGAINALKLNGGNLYIGGDGLFCSDCTDFGSNIIRYNIETDTFYNLGSGIFGSVNAIEHSGGYVYAVGQFNGAGDKPANRIARWAGPEVLKDRHTATIPGPAEGWHLLGSPVASTTYGEFLNNIWTQGYTGSNYPQGGSNVFVYNQWSGSWQVPQNEKRIVGSITDWEPHPLLYTNRYNGIAVYVYADDNYDGTPNPWPKSIEVQGIQNHRAFNQPLQRTNNNGWQLLSNPFPFPVSWSSVAEGLDPDRIHSNLYIWDANRAGGADYIDSASEEFSGTIAPFQGFWVRTLQDVTFRIGPEHQSAGEGESGVLLSTEEIPTLRLSVSGSGKHTQSALLFDDERAMYPESFNAYRMSSLEAEYLHVFTTMPGNTDAWRTQYLPLTQTFVKEVPLFIQTTSAGEFTLQVSEFPQIPGTEIYLTDHVTGEQMLLSEGFSHMFILDEASTKKIDTRPFESRFAEMKPAVSVNKNNSDNRFTLTVALTATNIDVESELPQTTYLAQNYPNPFNPTTNITFGLPESGNVRLEVYNVMGQRVATLVNNQKPAGYHTASFDAANLSSGVYIYRLTVGNFVQTRKMLLVK